MCAGALAGEACARAGGREASEVLGATRLMLVRGSPLYMHRNRDALAGIDDPGGACIPRLWPNAADAFDFAFSGRSRLYFPTHGEDAGGCLVSSIAQNGIDQTKSADVPVRVRPGIPSKIGGLPVAVQYQDGCVGPSGPVPSSLKPNDEVIVPAWFQAERLWQVMHDEVSTNPASVTELPTRVAKPVLSMKST
jgi:hypothetical protein